MPALKERFRLAFPYAIAIVAVMALTATLMRETEAGEEEVGSLHVVGSETMRPLVTACAEDFMRRRPEADVIVRGGGSGDGVAALLTGIADIGMISRPLTAKERAFPVQSGVATTVSAVAVDGVAVIVASSNKVRTMTLAQLRAVFLGEIRNWRDLGGDDGPILVYGRAAGSGTAAAFSEFALGGAGEAGHTQTLATNQAVVAEVAAHANAIGYASLGAMRDDDGRVRTLGLAPEPAAGAVWPNADTLRAGTYPIRRQLSFALGGHVTDLARAFVESCAPPKANALILRAGFLPATGGAQ